jgi:Flp pilus assembly protein TadD
MMLPAVLLVFWLVAACSSRADAGRNQRSGLRLRRAAGIGLLLALLHGFVDVPNHRLAYGLVVAVLAAVAVNPSWLRVPVGPPARAGFRIAGLALLVLAAVHVSQMRGWLPELESTAELLHRRAVDASAARRHNEAYELADRAVALSPLNFRMYYLRAQLALQLRLSPDDALMDFGRARALEPGYAATCLQEGMYWLGFRPLFAVIPWRECLRRDPEYAVGPHGNYQMMLNQMGRHPELLDPLWQLADRLELQVLFLNASPGGELWQERLEEVLAQNPRLELADKALLKTLFDAWGARGDRARLVALLTEHPEWLPYGWRHLAEERARAGRFREAFELASTQVPPPPRATSLLASDVPRLERVVLMNPNDPRPAVELYHALCAAGDDKQALRVLEKVARLPNAPPFLPLELAQAHARLGDYERAWQVVTEYLAKAS